MSEKEVTPANEEAKAAEEFFPGGPTTEQIENWKTEFKTIEMLPVGGSYFIYRQITRIEHMTLAQTGVFDGEDADEQMIKTLLLFPKYSDVNWDDEGAGTMSTLSNAMLRLSGFQAEGVPVKL